MNGIIQDAVFCDCLLPIIIVFSRFPCFGAYIRISYVENKLMVTKGESGGGINWEIGIDIYTLLDIKSVIRTYCIA